MIELSHDLMLIVFGMFYLVVLQLIGSIGDFFLEKALYYRFKYKQLKSKKEDDFND